MDDQDLARMIDVLIARGLHVHTVTIIRNSDYPVERRDAVNHAARRDTNYSLQNLR